MQKKEKGTPQKKGEETKLGEAVHRQNLESNQVTRSISDKDLKLLWGLSAAICSFPDCKKPCIVESTATDPNAIIGKIAHIEAHSDKGPRANPSLSIADRNHYTNLILLCSNHHDTVDFQPNTFTKSDLQKWKRDHESWVKERLKDEIPNVSFAELEITCKALLSVPSPSEDGFHLITPLEKIRKNELSNDAHFLISMGLAKAREVEVFISHMVVIDPRFPERLISGFYSEYVGLRSQGILGDALFQGMLIFAGGTKPDFRQSAAGLAVLAYLFHKCDVFES